MLDLYQAEGCPYYETVRKKLTDIGRSVVLHNPRTASGTVRNEQTHSAPTSVSGEDQIPFLVDTDRDVTLYESDDIVEYLEKHYA